MKNNVEYALKDIKTHLSDNSCSCFIGAGFSKNAVKDYPDWYELLYTMVEEIYNAEFLSRKKIYEGTKKSDKDIKYNLIKEKGILKVPEDYVHFKGKREYLDNYIEKNILSVNKKKKEYKLHTKLMEISWNDIVTTNWDTLFEDVNHNFVKANDEGHKYNVVYEAKQLADSAHRRIVKIHGSVKSKHYKENHFDNCFRHKFIVSQSDFDNYKTEHDDFNNFMKVAFLQNTFCLFGFSGDDPNFQYWIRELRKTMTKGGNTKSPRNIYLFSYTEHKNINEADIQFYQNNNITLITIEELELYLRSLPKNDFEYDDSVFSLSDASDSYNKARNTFYNLFSYLSKEHDAIRTAVTVADNSGKKFISYYDMEKKREDIQNWKENDFGNLVDFFNYTNNSFSTFFSQNKIEPLVSLYKKLFTDKKKENGLSVYILRYYRQNDFNEKYEEFLEKIKDIKECNNIIKYEDGLDLFYNFEYDKLQTFLNEWTPEKDNKIDYKAVMHKIFLMTCLDTMSFMSKDFTTIEKLLVIAEDNCPKDDIQELYNIYFYHNYCYRLVKHDKNISLMQRLSDLYNKGAKKPYEFFDDILESQSGMSVRPNSETRYDTNEEVIDQRLTFNLAVLRLFNKIERSGIPLYVFIQREYVLPLLEKIHKENKEKNHILLYMLLIHLLPFFGDSSEERTLRSFIPNILRYLSKDFLIEIEEHIRSIIDSKIKASYAATTYIYFEYEILKRLPRESSKDFTVLLLNCIKSNEKQVTSNFAAGRVWGWYEPIVFVLKNISDKDILKSYLLYVMKEYLYDVKSYKDKDYFHSYFLLYYIELMNNESYKEWLAELFSEDEIKSLINEDIKERKELSIYALDFISIEYQKEIYEYIEDNYSLMLSPYFVKRIPTEKMKERCVSIIKNHNLHNYDSRQFNFFDFFISIINIPDFLNEQDLIYVYNCICEKYEHFSKLKSQYTFEQKHYIDVCSNLFFAICEIKKKADFYQIKLEERRILTIKNSFLSLIDFSDLNWVYDENFTAQKWRVPLYLNAYIYLGEKNNFDNLLDLLLLRFLNIDNKEFEWAIQFVCSIFRDEDTLITDNSKNLMIKLMDKYKMEIPFCYDDIFIAEKMKTVAEKFKKTNVTMNQELLDYWLLWEPWNEK